jgi:ribosomal protein L18
MSEKNVARLRRARQTRVKIVELGAVLVCIIPAFIFAQVIDASGEGWRRHRRRKCGRRSHGSNIAASKLWHIAERPETGHRVAFDRSEHRFHGRQGAGQASE